MAIARAWDRPFAVLPPALADQKLCEYTRVLQLSALEQRVYAGIEAELDAGPEPVKPRKKYLAWLTVVGLTLYPMCARHSRPHVAACPARPLRLFFSRCPLPPRRCLGIVRRARASAPLLFVYNRSQRKHVIRP